MFKVVPFENLKNNIKEHTNPPVIDSFVIFNDIHGVTRILSTKKRTITKCMSLDEAVELAAKMNYEFVNTSDNENDRTDIDLFRRITQAESASLVISKRNQMVKGTYALKSGALAWSSSHNCLPIWCFKEAMVAVPKNQESEIEAQQDSDLKLSSKPIELMTEDEKLRLSFYL